MKRSLLTILTLAAALAGCNWIPSGARIFGTPLTRVESKEAKEDTARNAVLRGAQEAVHKAGDALASAGDDRPAVVARDFVSEAQALLDQSLGTPPAGTVAEWRNLVNRLLSENAEIRQAAERERRDDAERISEIATKLADATAARAAAEAKVREYAAENERIADMLRKMVWFVGAIAGLWLLGQVLAIAGRFNPALAGVSAVVNTVAAPGVQFIASRAQTGLQRVGEGMALIRRKLPEAAEKVAELMNQRADDDHQTIIGNAASAAGGGPPKP